MTTTELIDVTHLEGLEGGLSGGSRSRSSFEFGEDSNNVPTNTRSFTIPITAEFASKAYMAMAMDDANFDGVKHHPESRLQALMVVLTSVVGVMALSSAAFSVLAMIVASGSAIVYLCFGLTGLVVAPAVVIQRSRLQWEPSTFCQTVEDT